jgi:6-phosphofructokinase 1
MLIEVMGRYAGWIALGAGLAGGGDIILMPEVPYDIGAVCEKVRARNSSGHKFSIVVVGEGAKALGGESLGSAHSPDAIRLAVSPMQLAAPARWPAAYECRVTILGHLLRGGSPTARDRILATRFGTEALHLAARGEYNKMVALRGGEVTTVPLCEVAGKFRKVTPDHPWVKTALSTGICLGVSNDVPLEEAFETAGSMHGCVPK